MPLTAEMESTLVEDRPVAITAELEQLLNGVEYYQPLYGITGRSGLPMRSRHWASIFG